MDNYEQLTISDLRSLLAARGLSTHYRLKADLIDRIRKNRLVSTLGLSDDETLNSTDHDHTYNSTIDGENDNVFENSQNDGSDQDKSENQGNSENNDRNNSSINGENDNVFKNSQNDGSDQDKSDNQGNSENDDTSSDDDEDDASSTKDSQQESSEASDDNMAPALSFKDVADALDKFGGGPHENIEHWITAFEKQAVTCAWDSVHKYVYARKLMEAEAKACMEAEVEISTYDELVAYLRKEYPDKTTTLDIHNLLVNRKKNSKESLVEYMYAMLKIGKIKMDKPSMIRYIVDGIPGERKGKSTLYEADSYEELKTKLRVYQIGFDEYSKQRENNGKPKQRNNDKTINTKFEKNGAKPIRHCVNCGDKNHQTDDCPEKDKGRKCFNCEQFGHMATDCRVPRKPKETKKSTYNPQSNNGKKVLCVTNAEGHKMNLSIIINTIKLLALFDTGSPYTIMRKSIYKALPNMGKWIVKKLSLKGLAETRTSTLGYKWVTVTINNDNYDLQCYIVEDYLLPMEMILGRDLLALIHITIVAGEPTIKRFVPDIPENDIMVIQPFEEKNDVNDLPCIQEIQDPDMRAEVADMVRNYRPKVIHKSCIQMELVLEDNIPVYQNPRRLSVSDREVANAMVAKFLEAGIIRPSRSPYASPILLRKKKNGTHRFCIDYRKVNKKIVKDRYPLPIMEDVVEDLNEDLVHSSLDLIDGFYHVDMAEDSVKYTAFITPDGQWEFLKAPQGLCNSPANFQRYINTVFHEAKMEKLLKLYLDDVLVSSKDEATNLVKLRRTLTIAAEAGLHINFNKCKFLQRCITFLGYIIENHNIHPSEDKQKAIQKYPRPNNVKAIQSFLGLTGYFRKFIANYATIARPLSDLLRKDRTFRFGEEQEESYNKLKMLLCSDPVLKLYNPKALTELHTDASSLGYGGCLLQKQADDGLMHPVYYLSFKTTPAESKLHSYELEVLAIIKCLDRLRVYLMGIPFVIYTDCQAFQQTMAKKNATAKVARWALQLEEYDVEVRHRPGVQMKHVDALSRDLVMVIEDGLLSQLALAQKQDDECKLLHAILKNGSHENYILRQNVIYKHNEGSYLLKVPKSMTSSILTTLHGDAHLSRRRMELLAKQEYDIPELGKKIDKLITNCIPCILATKKKGKLDGWLESIDKFDTPLHTYHVDHVGPIPSTKKCYNHCFVVVDAFSKFVWIYPVKSTGAEEAIQKLKAQQEIFGNPTRIIADKYSSFRSEAFTTYCTEQNIDRHLITTGVPRGNGQVERIMGIIVPILTKMAINHPEKWHNYTARVQTSINSNVSRSTKRSPFELMFGVKMKSAEDLQINEVIEQELINEFDNTRREWREQARVEIQKVQAENQRGYNKKRKTPRLYTVGELVAIERTQNEKGLKVRPKMLGPYEITRVLRHNRYEVRKVGFNEGPISTSTAADKMKPWVNSMDGSDSD